MSGYQLKSLKLPKLTGMMLRIFAAAVENPLGRALLLNNLLENGGIPKLRNKNYDQNPTFYPLPKSRNLEPEEPVGFYPDVIEKKVPFLNTGDFVNGYLNGSFTPEIIAKRFLQNIEKSENEDSPLRAFIATDREDLIIQAGESLVRYKQRKPLGPLDGVPIAIKDEVDMVPYPTTVGTRFLGSQPAGLDATVVSRLRAAGALLVGKANMHEIGINPNGSNVNFGAVRNPYNKECDPGGSSSGSAAAVAAGLVAAAIGADGGGSIRIPASLCGVVGLKATFGRISEFGAAPLCWSVAHLGPIANCVEDVALLYSIIAGPDPMDANTTRQPPVTLKEWNRADLQGLRLGIYKDWFEHASSEVISGCQAMLSQFEQAGAEIVEINIPELDEMRIAHAITILSEMALCMKRYKKQRHQHGAAVRMSLVLGEALTSSDYIQAQRVRTRSLSIFGDVFRQVNVILTPGTALTAQSIPKGGLESGWSDLSIDTEMMRFVFPGNLAGLPAISFPVGYDQRGLPIGMQAIGNHWQETILLRVAYNAERMMERLIPACYFDAI
jgi:Asp-tRNA(Asn)/Glu-tRNA(Gln) amidotransferase A subunit family amidase